MLFQIGQTAENCKTLEPSIVWAAPASLAAHARGDERAVSVLKGTRSAHTQAALTGARTTPSARADAHGRKERRTPNNKQDRGLIVVNI